MGIVETVAAIVLVLSIPVGIVGIVGLIVASVRGARSGRKGRAMRLWAIVAGVSAVVFVMSAVIGTIAAQPRLRREREAAYVTATALLSEGNVRGAIPFLVKVGPDLDDKPDAPKKLAEARRYVQAEAVEKLNKAAAEVDLGPQTAKSDVAAAMLGINEALLGDRYRRIEDQAHDIVARADSRLAALSAAPQSSAPPARPAAATGAVDPTDVVAPSPPVASGRAPATPDEPDGADGVRTEWRVGDREGAALVVRELVELEAKGRDMESVRRSKDLAVIGRCGVLMRERQPRADALRERAAKLPFDIRVFLDAAAVDLNLCVSCVESAVGFCDTAHQEIQSARGALRTHD